MKKIFKTILTAMLITCMTFSITVPSFAANKTYYVDVSQYLNIRSGAGTQYKKVGTYQKGTKITSVQQKNGWHKTSKGWISGNYLSSKNPLSKSKTYYVTASVLNVRSGAGTSYKKVASYKKGAKVESTQQKNGWHKTAKGWVSGDYLSTKAPNNSSSGSGFSSGSYVKTVGNIRVTAYCAGRCCNGSWSSGSSTTTASGIRLYNSSKYANKYCAATPSVGKLGQKVKMNMNGKTYTLKIVDRLGSSSGRKVDFFIPSHSQCNKFGVKSGVTGKIYK